MCYYQVIMSKVYYTGEGSYRENHTYSIDEFIDIFNKNTSNFISNDGNSQKIFDIKDLDTLLSLTGATLREVEEE